MSVKQLRDALSIANQAEGRLRNERSSYVSMQTALRVDPVRQAIEAEAVTRFDAAIVSAVKVHHLAQEAYDDARVAEAAVNTEWLPVGTRVFEWKYQDQSYRSRVLSGRAGVVEVWSRDSLHPANRSWLPSPGQLIVRHLKKDGTPSATFDERGCEHEWFAAGVDPNKITEKV